MPRDNSDTPDPSAPAYRLTLDDAVEVWLMHWDGWLNHRIAARFDTNQGRIAEVLTGTKFPEARAIAEQQRPAA